MESENNVDDINFQKIADFMTAEELVSLRKPKEDQHTLNVGPKFTMPATSQHEEIALESALGTYEESLAQKRATRICDLIEAVWDDKLNAALTSKLKGKFVQHMGQLIDGQIALSSEESLFLLENGCIEIMYEKKPLSTEEAYALLLKGNLCTEKYQVYSHLSQLGFIVVTHQKRLNSKTQTKTFPLKVNEKKRQKSSPDKPNKRITFSGALSEDSFKPSLSKDLFKPSLAEDSLKPSLAEDSLKPSLAEDSLKPSLAEDSLKPSDTEAISMISAADKVPRIEVGLLQGNTIDSSVVNNVVKNDSSKVIVENCDSQIEVEEIYQESEHIDVESTDQFGETSNGFENKIAEPVQEIVDIEEMDVESREADASLEVLEKSADIEVNDEDSHVDVLNNAGENSEDEEEYEEVENSDLVSCSSESQNNATENLCADDEITLLEVTKKKTEPLAVIDLLSDEEHSANEPVIFSDSDDDIRIIEVCKAPANKAKPLLITPPNLNKLNSEKIQRCKRETVINRSNATNSTPLVQFPYMCRKDLVCMPRPPLHLLPLHVQPNKEVYVHAFSKKQSEQPPNRLWNSYKDMQDYQRSRRLNRHLGRPKWPSNRHDSVYSGRHDSGRLDRSYSNRHDSNYSNWQPFNTPPDTQPWNRNRRNGDDTHSRDLKPFTQTNSPFELNRSFSSGETTHQHPLIPNPPFMPPIGQPGFLPGFPPVSPNMPNSSNFAAEVHKAAFSYATVMLSSMFGQNINPNNIPNPPFEMMGHMNGTSNSRNAYFDRNQQQRNNPFPCRYRHINNKRSWTDVRSSSRNKQSSDSSDVEEIPINTNEFLWNVSNICPLVKPGSKLVVPDVLKSLQLTRQAELTNKKKGGNELCFPENPVLEITFDVYLPGTNFKKSSPEVPKYRIIICRASDPVPRYSELAVLQRRWDDGAALQVAVVEHTHISFCSLNSVSLPQLIPFN